MPIRIKLVLFAIACSILPLLGVFSFAFDAARTAINQTVETSLITQATEELYTVQGRLANTKKTIISWGDLAVMQNVSNDALHGTIQNSLETLVSENPQFTELIVLKANGKVVAATNPDLIGSDHSGSWRYEAANLGINYDGPVSTSPIHSQRMASQSVPIYATSGRKRIIGVLIGCIGWKDVLSELANRKLFDGQQSQQRQIILQSLADESILYSSAGTTPPAGLLESTSDETTFQSYSHLGNNYMTASVTSSALDEFRDPQWRLHVVLDADIAYAGVRQLREQFHLTGAIVLVLVTALAYLLARSIVAPVKSLVHSAERLASGDYDYALTTSTGNDEIGQLTTSFEKMRCAIKDKEQKLITETEVSRQAAKLKGEFLANMSHEVRTPINGVLGMTELLMNTELDDTQSRYASTIFRSGQSLLGVINDILDFSKIEAGKLELQNGAFDLRDLVEDCVELLAESAHSKGIELALHMAPESHVAYQGDSSRLRQVLLNLMGNAVKFTDEGEVKIMVTCRDFADAVTEVRFDVIDTGIGIEKDALHSIFESFVQADGSTTRKFGGTGLGLSISAKLAELMNGRICVESEVGSGSNFWFTAQVEKLPSSVQKAWQSNEALLNKRILIVDDNKTNCEILQSQILYWGAEPVVTNGGQEALRQLQTSRDTGQHVDIAILDMHMPGMNGLELAVAIREHVQTTELKLVLLSSVCDQLDADTCKAIGINTMITKPVRQPDLYNCLTAAINDSEMVQNKLVVEKIETSQLSGRVLLAEDNPVNQEMMLELLRLLGVEAVLAENGQQALDAIAKEPFDVVLMDCQMPVLDGFAATRAIRTREHGNPTAHRIPIVALTANALQGDRENCLACGMDEYLSKPVSASQLRVMLSNWLATVDQQQEQTPTDQSPHAVDKIEAATTAMSDVGSTSAEPVLDQSVFNEVLVMASQAPGGFYDRLVSKYTEGSAEDISRITAAIENQDADTVSASAHRLKSSSANWGARQMAAACQELESAARAGRLEQATAYLNTIEAELQRVLLALSHPQSKAA